MIKHFVIIDGIPFVAPMDMIIIIHPMEFPVGLISGNLNLKWRMGGVRVRPRPPLPPWVGTKIIHYRYNTFTVWRKNTHVTLCLRFGAKLCSPIRTQNDYVTVFVVWSNIIFSKPQNTV